MNRNKKSSTLYMVDMALMIAIILVMSYTPLGYFRTPGLSITLLTVPVAVGAILLGPVGGAICGLTFGLTSFYNAFTTAGLGQMMLAINPFYTFIVCVVSRVLEGLLTGLIFKGLHSANKTRPISYYVASLACPLLNTLFFMSTLVIFFYPTDLIQGYVEKLGATNPFMFVLLFVGLQGLFEAVVCFVVASAVSRILYHVLTKTAMLPESKREKEAA